jgi:hypothetical protein
MAVAALIGVVVPPRLESRSASIARDRARAAIKLSSSATASKIVSAAGPSGSPGTKSRDGGTWKKSNASGGDVRRMTSDNARAHGLAPFSRVA